MTDTVTLLGLDFGTTTSSAIIATARMARNCVTGRMELSHLTEEFRSDPVFTPFLDDRIDEPRLMEHLEQWLAEGKTGGGDVFGGGVLITGLAAQQANAAPLTQLIRRRLGDSILVVAGEANLESWMAFMGSCAVLSRNNPLEPILNLDIGGGTTNLAMGIAGEVRETGCYFIGARHFQFEPGTYRLVRLSKYAAALLESLGIAKRVGETMTPRELEAVLDFYVTLLEALCEGRTAEAATPIVEFHRQTDFLPEKMPARPAITLSGGVGELVYGSLRGLPWASTTFFGDLGIDLARRILASPILARDLKTHVPDHQGRATVFGMMRHSMDISGSTVYLSAPNLLPLRDLPIVGRISNRSGSHRILEVMELVRESPSGGCLRVDLEDHPLTALRQLGKAFGEEFRARSLPADRALVLFVPGNYGKTLGGYVSDWGRIPLKLIVIDEVQIKDAQFAQVGKARDQVIPVWCYGLQ